MKQINSALLCFFIISIVMISSSCKTENKEKNKPSPIATTQAKAPKHGQQTNQQTRAAKPKKKQDLKEKQSKAKERKKFYKPKGKAISDNIFWSSVKQKMKFSKKDIKYIIGLYQNASKKTKEEKNPKLKEKILIETWITPLKKKYGEQKANSFLTYFNSYK